MWITVRPKLPDRWSFIAIAFLCPSRFQDEDYAGMFVVIDPVKGETHRTTAYWPIERMLHLLKTAVIWCRVKGFDE